MCCLTRFEFGLLCLLSITWQVAFAQDHKERSSDQVAPPPLAQLAKPHNGFSQSPTAIAFSALRPQLSFSPRSFGAGNASLDASNVFVSPLAFNSGGFDADAVVAIDVNGDGILDALLANFCATSTCLNGNVAVALGNGDGTFRSPTSYNSGGYEANSIAVADVNGDGKPDLLVANLCVSRTNCATGTIGVLLGNGDGTFRPAISYNSGGYNTYAVVVADVNADAKPDLLVANLCRTTCSGIGNGSVSVLLGNGDGTFHTATTYSSGGDYSHSLAVGDVNGDGKPDIVVVNDCDSGGNCAASMVGVLVGNGDGTFQTAGSYASGGYHSFSIAMGDLNHDGKPDLLLANFCPNSADCTTGIVGVLLGNGDGTFRTAVGYPSGGLDAFALSIADLNQDGNLDVVVTHLCDGSTSCANGTLGVLLGHGDGTFQSALSYGSAGNEASAVAIADVNGDGKLDVLTTNYCVSSTNCPNGDLSVSLGQGDGTFLAGVTYAPGGYDSVSIATADVNGDGQLDLLVANQCFNFSDCPNSNVAVMLGNGDGSFNAASTYGSGGVSVSSIAVADVNADGIPDLLVANNCSSGASCANGSVAVLQGRGDGTFQPAVAYASGGENAFSVSAADVNGDGLPDLLVANFCLTSTNCSSGLVGVLIANANGTYQPAVTYNSGGDFAHSLATADLNGDGHPDIVVANNCAPGNCNVGAVGVLLGNGDGTFQLPVSYLSGGYNAFAVAIGDVNGDGKPDVVVVNYCSNANCTTLAGNGIVGVLLGNGDGTFRTTITTLTPGIINLGQIALADLNGDGKLDIASAAGNFVLFGNGDGTFATGTLLGVGGGAIVAGDFNGDGAPDLAAGGLTILLNRNSGPTIASVALTSNVNPAANNQVISFTATVTGQNGTPTGNVTFYNGSVALGNSSLVNGKASLQSSFSSNCNCSITAAYSGDSRNLGNTSSPYVQYVKTLPIVTTTTQTTSNANVNVGQSVTFTAQVSWTHGAPPDGELVTFKDVSVSPPLTLGSAALSGGTAIFSTSALSAGTHTVRAKYAGDATYASSFADVTETVTRWTTTTSLSSSLNPAYFGQTVVLTAQVATAGPNPPTGTVSFFNGTVLLGTSSLNSNGVAQWTTTALPTGTDALTAMYNRDASNGYSTSPVLNQIINKAIVNMALASTPNPSTMGQNVKFTATLTSTGNAPTSTVTFTYGTTIMGTSSIVNGVAVLSTSTLLRGTDLVTASYSGNANHTPASASISQQVN